ncbi:hypothetical protein ACQ4PT_056090 [Festuca glaucescens]
MEAVGTIVKVVYEIVKVAETARQNRKRCLDLADRARTVGDILREDRDSTTSRTAGAMRKPALERLKAALDDALELVESQRRFGLGIPGRTAAKFQDVETRITACVVDLGLAEQMAARRRDHRANAEAAPVQELPQQQQQQGKDGPSLPQQQGKAGPSLPQGYLAQTALPPESFYNQYLEQQQQTLLQAQQFLLQAYLPQSAPPPAQSLLQGYLGKSAQQGRDAQSFVQGYLAQSAQQGKEAQSFVQGYLAQSAQQGKDAKSLVHGYLAQLASSQHQGQDVQSLLKGYGYFAM